MTPTSVDGSAPAWLASIPDHAVSADPIVLQSCLARAPAGRIRLVIGELCLEFGVADVVSATELPAAVESRAIFAEVRLRPGAALLAVHDVAALQSHASAGDLPFALAARPGRLIIPPSPDYGAAEAGYLERRGMLTHDPDPRAT
jgi:hypothetical protein